MTSYIFGDPIKKSKNARNEYEKKINDILITKNETNKKIEELEKIAFNINKKNKVLTKNNKNFLYKKKDEAIKKLLNKKNIALNISSQSQKKSNSK